MRRDDAAGADSASACAVDGAEGSCAADDGGVGVAGSTDVVAGAGSDLLAVSGVICAGAAGADGATDTSGTGKCN